MTLGTILMVIALLCFVLAAFNATVKRVSLLPLGLAFWVLAMLLDALKIRVG